MQFLISFLSDQFRAICIFLVKYLIKTPFLIIEFVAYSSSLGIILNIVLFFISLSSKISKLRDKQFKTLIYDGNLRE